MITLSSMNLGSREYWPSFMPLIEDMKRSISKKSILRTLPSVSVWKLFQRKPLIPVFLLLTIPLRSGNANSVKRNPSIISSSRCRKNFSDKERLRNYLRERFNAYCNPSVLDEEVKYFDRAVETVNFIRSLSWIFGTPLPALSLAEFLSPDQITLYETKKKQVNKDN